MSFFSVPCASWWQDVARGALIWKGENNYRILIKSIISASYHPLCNSHSLESFLGVIVLKEKKCIIWTFNHEARNRLPFRFLQNDYLSLKKRNPHWKCSRDNESFHTSIPTIYLPLGRSLPARPSFLPESLALKPTSRCGGLEISAVFRPALISTPIFILQILMGEEGKWLPYASPNLSQIQKETHA